jgi:Protein of unknown function (DUF664)
MSDEPGLLLRFLEAQRRHVMGALDGLSEADLRRPILPSGWSCLGMLKHLALADEHYWFRCVVGGETFDFFPTGPDAEWRVGDDESVEDVFGLYRDEIARANEIVTAAALDAPPRQRDARWEEWGLDFPDLRYIMLHVITETACHAGHLDAARELVDGRQWIVQ